MSRSKVTRADVARVAGTSVAVVSYVVNNGPRPVAVGTRRRVLAAIEATGYRPDGVARALATGSTQTYGLIVPNVANPFVASLAHAIEDEAFRGGFSLLLGDSADDQSREAELVNTFLQHQIDGLMFYGVDRGHPWLDQATGKIPVVILGEPGPAPGVAYVRVDERAASAAATRHLIEHGYRAIATVSGPLNQTNSRDRVQGWRDALVEAGLEDRAELLVESDYTRRGGYDAAARILRLSARPDAVFAANEQQALGFLAAADEHGTHVPEDIALICFNGTSNAEYSIPALSTVEQPVEELAAHAVGLLGEPPAADGRTVVCDFRLTRRRSCGCAYSRDVAADAASVPGEVASCG
jgi:LacI family transcriptional regulator